MDKDHSTTEAKPAIEEEKASMDPKPCEDAEKALGDPKTTTESPADQQEYPPMRKVIVIMLSLYMAMFLVSLVSSTIS